MEPARTENLDVWDEVPPILDEALNHLSDAGRPALLLRFFGQKPMRDVGRVLGVSEITAMLPSDIRQGKRVCGRPCKPIIARMM